VTLAAVWSADGARPGDALVLAVVLSIQEGYHIIADAEQVRVIKDFKPIPTQVRPLSASTGVIAETPQYPQAAPLNVDFIDSPIPSFGGQTVVYLPVHFDATTPPGPAAIQLEVQFQACSAASCLMPRRQPLEAAIAVVPAGQETTPTQLELFAAWGRPKEEAGIRFDLFGWGFTLNAASAWGWSLLLVTAGVGGFLLNFTPCVLPLIPIKIISLSNAAGHRRRCLKLGLATFAGVLSFWIGLGAGVSLVSGMGATHQLFQYPLFTIAVGALIAAMALGLLLSYSVQLPAFLYALNPRQETLSGAFGIGMLTAVLSTPCTAPFMGAAAAWAVTQVPLTTLTVFAAIGAGMGLPYAVLAAFPGLIRRLPKTGPANELLKQVMAVFMLAAAAYFIGIGASSLAADADAPVGSLYWWPVMAFCAAGGAMAGFRAARLSRSKIGRTAWAVVGLMVVAAALAGGVTLTDTGPLPWLHFTPARLEKALRDGNIVLMVFTAEWCLNCKALEQSVWRDPGLAKLASHPGVVAMKADLTGSNPAGREKLREAGSLTIPLLVVYASDGRPIFRSDFYTADQVMAVIRGALVPSRPVLD
jgi:thiol:disulfide interchange protein DsbD